MFSDNNMLDSVLAVGVPSVSSKYYCLAIVASSLKVTHEVLLRKVKNMTQTYERSSFFVGYFFQRIYFYSFDFQI